MELKYFVLEFDNGKEYLIESTSKNAEAIMDKLSKTVVKLVKNNKEDGPSIIIGKNKLFSVHEMSSKAIGNNSKKWRLVE